MAIHDRFIATAVRLIEKHGRSVTFQKLTATAADAQKPWKTPGSNAEEYISKAVFLPSNDAADFGRLIENSELLKVVSEVAMVAYTGTDLSDFDKMKDGIKVRGIEWVQVLKPGDQIIMYFFGFK